MAVRVWMYLGCPTLSSTLFVSLSCSKLSSCRNPPEGIPAACSGLPGQAPPSGLLAPSPAHDRRQQWIGKIWRDCIQILGQITGPL